MEKIDTTACNIIDLPKRPNNNGQEQISVLIPLPLAKSYNYSVPENLKLEAGDFVKVPLGSREVVGVVWKKSDKKPDASKIKSVISRLEVTPLPTTLRKFVDWLASYSVTPPGAVLRMAMNVRSVLAPPKPLKAYTASEGLFKKSSNLRITQARKRVLDLLANSSPKNMHDLCLEATVSRGVVDSLAKTGYIETLYMSPETLLKKPDPDHQHTIKLSKTQQNAANFLSKQVNNCKFDVTLLDGVTGSGKTEVYFEAIATSLRLGQQALVLLPEISLTPQWFDRFQRRFSTAPIVWHSELSESKRRVAWQAIATSEACVVVGARSALFLPFQRLGVLIVDEEHEGAYKQIEGVTYQARDMAIVRAKLSKCLIVLSSATPSLETRVNVLRKKFNKLELPGRYGSAVLPVLEAFDMRDSQLKSNEFLSLRLREALNQNIISGEQSLLFLNRRGYAPLTLCRKCGHRLECPSCSAWLVEHRLQKSLQCHHCEYRIKTPDTCPHCEASNSLSVCGPGVERVAEELKMAIPHARVRIMTSDTIRGPKAGKELIGSMESQEIDILVGTQMVAKGHHFPNLTLVGIVDADLGLSGGDLRASERTYQVLHQVAGRAGRAKRPGHVILQTYQPNHPVMKAMVNGDRESFMELEEKNRKDGGWPPFGRLAAIIVTSNDSYKADNLAAELAYNAPLGKDISVLGPAPAPLAILRGQHRRRLLLKTNREQLLQPLIRKWLERVTVPSNTRIRIDIDPYNFM